MASLSGVFNVQQFADAGNPLVGGRLYTYSAGTTTHKTAYTDKAGTIPHTYTSDGIGGQYIALTARGEIPANLYFLAGAYDVTLKTASGATVWTRRADQSADPDDYASTAAGKGGFLVGWLRSLTGAVATTIADLLGWGDVNVFEFMTPVQITDVVNRTLSVDVTTPVQAAIDAAWKSGRKLRFPGGSYLVSASTLNIPPAAGYEYRADSFTMYGDGAANGFLGDNISHGTTFVSNIDAPILTYTNRLSNGNNIFIEKIRFQQNNLAATSPVLYFQIFMGHSRIADVEVRQAGTGDGIKIDYAYEGEIINTRVMNRDLVATGITRVGTGLNISAGAGAGGLMKLMRVSSRGWLIGYSIGYTTNSILSTILEQCECSTVTNGIVVNTGVRKTVIDTCYFEGVTGTCIQDKGNGTTVKESFFFEGYTIGIDSTNTNSFGSVYSCNEFNVNTAASTCIALYSDGDALGHKKVVDGNYIYFLGSGGTTAGVVGISITGANPTIDLIGNTFRPRRAWVGGAGTIKIQDSSTGYNTGSSVLTDALMEIPMISNNTLAFAPYPSNLTESSVSAGVLTVSPSHWTILAFTVATNVTQINDGAKGTRLIHITSTNLNATLVKGTFMILASNFSGYGSIVLQLRVIAGQTYAYEISRTMY